MGKCMKDILQDLSTCDLVEIILKSGYKSQLFFGFLVDDETFIGIGRYTLVLTICKVEDVESIMLIEKANDYFESNKQISIAEILKRLMDAKNQYFKLNFSLLRQKGII